MLGAMGLLGALVAGLSLPMVFGSDGDADSTDREDGDTPDRDSHRGGDNEEGYDGPLEAALDAAAEDMASEPVAPGHDDPAEGADGDSPDDAFSAVVDDGHFEVVGGQSDGAFSAIVDDGTFEVTGRAPSEEPEVAESAFSAVVDDGVFEVLGGESDEAFSAIVDDGCFEVTGGGDSSVAESPRVASAPEIESQGQPAGTLDKSMESQPGLDLGGTVGDDVLTGSDADDMIFGDFGDDVLEGGAGDDGLADGAGQDTLLGGAGDDVLSAVPADGEGMLADRDVLDGGAGDDTLLLSSADNATGGGGADSFLVGPGLSAAPDAAGAPAPMIEDFDSDEDALVVVWNDYAHQDPPELSLEPSPEDPEILHLVGDGEVLAEIRAAQGVSLDEVHLRPASSL